MKWFRVLPVVAIVGLIVYLSVTSVGDALTYYVTASEFQKDIKKFEHKKLKIAGRALAGSIVRDPLSPLSVKFVVHESGVHIPVSFQGITPDTFKDESEVVVTGTWSGDHFEATEILAKCASKYEEKIQP